ncbi:hypothetical protein AC579_10 [Pseudocercospora musae]|uniref:Uncharacterized protein n=1 Tax=Pseudocercospora musae TaxID=113226 RepID=A0A139I8A6_9PEZI|nr:hypothetical protein AC579_10 [Pseudocercospora musae]
MPHQDLLLKVALALTSSARGPQMDPAAALSGTETAQIYLLATYSPAIEQASLPQGQSLDRSSRPPYALFLTSSLERERERVSVRLLATASYIYTYLPPATSSGTGTSIPQSAAPSSMSVERRPSNLAKHESQTLPLDLSLNSSHSDEDSSTYSNDAQNALEKEIDIGPRQNLQHTASAIPKVCGYRSSLSIRPKTAEPPPRQVPFESSPVRRRTSLGPIEQSPVSPTSSGFPSVVQLPPKLVARPSSPVIGMDEKSVVIQTGPPSSMDWAEPSRRRRRRWMLISLLSSFAVLIALGVALGVYFGLRDRHRT